MPKCGGQLLVMGVHHRFGSSVGSLVACDVGMCGHLAYGGFEAPHIPKNKLMDHCL
jgi:hypothetical protein